MQSVELLSLLLQLHPWGAHTMKATGLFLHPCTQQPQPEWEPFVCRKCLRPPFWLLSCSRWGTVHCCSRSQYSLHWTGSSPQLHPWTSGAEKRSSETSSLGRVHRCHISNAGTAYHTAHCKALPKEILQDAQGVRLNSTVTLCCWNKTTHNGRRFRRSSHELLPLSCTHSRLLTNLDRAFYAPYFTQRRISTC